MTPVDLSTPLGATFGLLPEIVLTGWGLVLLLVTGWRHQRPEHHREAGWITLAALVSTLAVVAWLWRAGVQPDGLAIMVSLDAFRWATDAIFLVGAIAAVLLALGYLGRERILIPEFYALLLFATVGMMLMGGAADLLIVFLGLELMSVSVYILAAIKRRSRPSAEAGLKYFLLGAFASGFLLYGIALIYGTTGTTNLATIAFQVGEGAMRSRPMLGLGIALLLVGLGFKVSAVPFHMWAPDVYDGAPTPVTAFMAAAVKAAGFAALVRVGVTALAAAPAWGEILWWLAAATMLVGNLLALAQRRLKRLLAYSSVAHAGYLLTAAAAGGDAGSAAFLFYALVYTLMTVGAFGILAAVGRDGESELTVEALNGLAQRRPWVALATSVFMLSLLGFPGTAGFIGKWLILRAAIGAGQAPLAVILVIASVLSAGYYLPVIMAMYMKPAEDAAPGERAVLVGSARAVVAAAAVALLLFGVWPNRVLDAARTAGADVRPPGVIVNPVGQ